MSKNDFHKKPGLPLYLQIKDHLLGKIDSGFWQEGEMVPTEAELCEAYKVSKITIREAVKLLVKDGKLKRTPGKGTFVIKNKLEQKLNRFFSFTRWAEQNGLRPASRILKVENMACDAQIAEHLSIRRGQAVTRIERLRIGGEEPLMLEVIWIPAALCPGIHLKDISNLPLNDILEKEYDITLVRATE
ncbi:MAG: GntR family transcriptional regulator [Spirochaetales bacterium]|nr:MAG: GntR family transcriptional regulator [Spirochaetales bacterium]